MARICAWQLVELGTDAHVSPDQRPTILDALLIECISLQYFLAALRLVIVTFVYHICRAASSSSPGSHSVVLSGLCPLRRSLLEPTCQRPAVSCISTLPIFTTSDHAQVEHTASKTISIVPALLSKTVSSSFSDTQPLVDVDTSSRCAKAIAWQKHAAFLKFSFMYSAMMVGASLIFLCFCIIFGAAVWVCFPFCLEGFSAQFVWANPTFIVVSFAFVSSCYLSWTCSSCVCRLLNFTCLL